MIANNPLVTPYSPIFLSAEEKDDFKQLAKVAFPALQQAATEKYGFANIKELRNEFKDGSVTLWENPRAARYMRALISWEEKIVRGHICQAVDICENFDRSKEERPGVTTDDYLQLCAFAIYDSIYMYNGSSEFSTYVTYSMRNRVVDFIKQEERTAGVGKIIKKWRLAVKKMMSSDSVSLDVALARLCATENLSNEVMEKLRDSMYAVNYIGSEADDSMAVVDRDTSETDAMRKALNETHLTSIQRRLMDAYLAGDKKFRTRLVKTEKNPNTGEFWTRARLGQIFQEACEAVQRTYNRQEKKAA